MNLLLHQNSEEEAEIVETIQGEGIYAGVPAFFIRLQGCNVHCFFCDEKETWINRENSSIEISIAEIITKLETINPLLKRVVITGGEPTEQALEELIKALIERSFVVSIESAATGAYTADLFKAYKNNLFITFSPKEPYSKSKIQDERIWQLASEVKFVVANNEAEEYLLQRMISKLQAANNHCPIFLVPDWFNIEETKKIVIRLCREYPNRFRMGWQLHKLIDMP